MPLSEPNIYKLPNSKGKRMTTNQDSSKIATEGVFKQIQDRVGNLSLHPSQLSIHSDSPISNRELSSLAEFADSVSTDKTDYQDDFGKYIPEGCLFVASLVSSRTEEQLQESVREHFKQWGELENVKVLKDPKNRPYSFVQFKDPECASKALIESAGSLVDRRPIRVERAKVNRTLYITKIAAGANEAVVHDSLATFGPIDEFKFVLSANESYEFNRCTIKYRYREDAISAFTSIKKDDVWGVEWENIEAKDIKKHDLFSLFIGNLSPKTTEDSLRNRFQQYGKIESLALINKPFDSYKYAFLSYVSKESCAKALEEDGNLWFDRKIRVTYKELKSANNIKPSFYNGFNNRRASCTETTSKSSNYSGIYPQYILPSNSVQATIGNNRPRFFPIETRSGIEGIWVPLDMLSGTEGFKNAEPTLQRKFHNSKLKKF